MGKIFSLSPPPRNWRHLGSEQPHQGTKKTPDIHKNLRVYWEIQTHIDEDFNSLVDLENAVLGKEVQNLKLQCIYFYFYYFLFFSYNAFKV